MNYFFAIALCILYFLIGPSIPQVFLHRPVVEWLDAGSSADLAGIQPGDVIIALNGEPVQTWREVLTAMNDESRKTHSVHLLRDGESLAVSLEVPENAAQDPNFPGFSYAIPARIGEVAPAFPAGEAGIQAGDLITRIEGQPVVTFQQLHDIVNTSADKPLAIEVRRGSEDLVFQVSPRMSKEAGRPLLGITAAQEEIRSPEPILGAVSKGFERANWLALQVTTVFGKLFTEKDQFDQVGGIITIGRMTGRAAQAGLLPYLFFLAMLSINLAIFNLLPIPVLDGGHIVFLGLELAFGKARANRIKFPALHVGIAFLLMLMVIFIGNDIRMWMNSGF